MTAAPTAQRTRAMPFPFMEQPVIGALLAVIAGLLNAWSLASTGTFATVQSGNLVTAGYAVAQGEWTHAAIAGTSILCFGLGAAVNSVVVTMLVRRGRSYSGPVLIVQAAILAVLALLAATAVAPALALVFGVSFVAGSQGNAFHRDHGMLYGNVAVTFVVQSVFSLLARAALPSSGGGRREDLRSAAIYAAVIIAFAGGAALGFLGEAVLPAGALWAGAAVTAALGVIAFSRRDQVHVDPSQNVPTP